ETPVESVAQFRAAFEAYRDRRQRHAETRRRALSLLDDALALSHRSALAFAPLESYRDEARVLKERLEGDTLPPAELGALAGGGHPLASLVDLVRAPV